MKRFLATILSFVLLAGCAQNDAENTIVQRDNGEPFYGSFEDVNATRTYVNEAMTMLWHADDRISLFRSTLNEEFKFTGETGDSAGDFEEIPSEIFVTGAEISTNYGVYPYNSTTTISEDETITLTMPSVQAYAQNSFGCGANTAVAATENSSSRFLPFRNVGGFLVVKIYSPSGVVKSVELKGNNGEVLAGEATVQAKYGYLPLLTMGDGTDSITLDCGGGVEVGTTEDSATHFWFVVPPTTFEEGFTVSVTDTAGAVTTKSTTKRNEILRNEVTVMSAFEIAETDSKPKPANNEIWYTNGSTTGSTRPTTTSHFGGATIVSNEYDSENGHWVITFDRELTTIGSSAFYGCGSLTSITIPDSVTTIGLMAFTRCDSLTSITIPDSVTTIGEWAFDSCESLTSITIPDGVTSIGEGAFTSCDSLTSITIPDGVTTIADQTFYGCDSLTSVTIPDSVTSIGTGAFSCCYSLTSITIPDSVTTIGYSAFQRCFSLTSVTIPDSVTTIREGAFSECTSLTEFKGKFAENNGGILIVDGVLIAFPPAAVGITEYTIPDSVTTIGYFAFATCYSLTSVTIPDSVTTIGEGAFTSCDSLTSVYCKPTIPPTGNYAMFDYIATDLKIYVPAGYVESYRISNYWIDYADHIVGYNFENGEVDDEEEDPSHPANPANSEIWYINGSTTEPTDPYSLGTFGDATIVSNEYDVEYGHWVITFDRELTTIGSNAFHGCRSLTSITIPDSVTEIGSQAFASCTSLAKVIISDSVTTIGNYAFENCDSLMEITIGKSVVAIGRDILDSCGSLRTVYCKPTTPPTCDGNAINFIGCDTTNVTLYVPVESMNSYVNHDRWVFYDDIMVPYNYETGEIVSTSIITYGGDGMIKFDEEAFDANIIAHYLYYSVSGYKIIFDGVITTIGEGAFSRAYRLTSISIPESVTSIGEGAFAESGLRGIGIPGSVKEIGSYAFAYCQYLTGVSIDKGVTKIGSNAFALCIGLSDITIPDSVTTIGYGAFSQCSRLEKVYCKATTPPSGDSDMFEDNAPGLTIYVPTDSVEAYKKAYGWRDYADAIVGYNF